MLEWVSLSILGSATVSNPFADWPAQLAAAIPFIFALAWVAKKLWDRMEKIELEKKELTDKLITDFVGTVKSATMSINSNTSVLEDVLSLIRDLKTELNLERTLRVRYEERLNIQSEVVPHPVRHQRGAKG